MKQLYFTIICVFAVLSLQAQAGPLVASDTLGQVRWVNQQYDQMSLDQKLGQLFMIQLSSNMNGQQLQKRIALLEEENLGGIIFSTGSPTAQLRLTNTLQNRARIPYLIAQDAEWGLAMRLDSVPRFPWNMSLGAIQDSSLVRQTGYEIGQQFARMGVHLNFAPVADSNTNPANPIIGNRSFGQEPLQVTQRAIAYMKGLQEAGIMSCAKHFPGHGDTATDSHKVLPYLTGDRKRLDSVELYPFEMLVDTGIESVMVAHLGVPALEKREGFPSSLSKAVVTDVLLKRLQFRGLVFTDAMDMKAVSTFAPAGEVELQAFLAGNDVLLMPGDVVSAKAKFKEAYQKGIINEFRLAASVKKILMAKYKAGLHQWEELPTEQLLTDLNPKSARILREQLFEESVTVIKNEYALLPLKNLEKKKIAYVHLGEASGEAFEQSLKKFGEVDAFDFTQDKAYAAQLKDYNLIIVGIHKSDSSPYKKFRLTKKEQEQLKSLAELRSSNLILTLFAKPYALTDIAVELKETAESPVGPVPSNGPSGPKTSPIGAGFSFGLVPFDPFPNIDGIVCAYQNHPLAQDKAAQVIFGAIEGKGRLPVSITPYPGFEAGDGFNTRKLARLGYTIPERVGFDPEWLSRVDTLVQQGLDSLMYPGAQVLIAKDGKVVYNKAFGKLTFEGEEELTTDHLFDLASLTKILSTLPILMDMEEDGVLELNNTFADLVPEYKETELKDVTVLKALSHYGRLPAWIAYYVNTLDQERKPSKEFYRNTPQPGFGIKINDKLYLSDSYRDTIYRRIGEQELKSNRYRYSDVGYYVFKKYIEDQKGQRLDSLADDFLYSSLGASNTLFNPLREFDQKWIVPTEEDKYFRYTTVRGYVHDMGAAMQNGVGGHAGLFSNANDVAKIMQMYLQGGYYGGQRYLQARTISKFNTCYFCHKDVRRGVGFDKPQLKEHGPTCGCVSRKSFGHSGFTGTYTWADPDKNLVYVFLSNRTYPSARNNLLITTELRTRIQQVIYDSLDE